jgi:exosome complex RNA-binding protein Rrp42 (RNase PH superfamily)
MLRPVFIPAAAWLLLQVLQADGSLLAVALNAVCAALADAGLPMRSMFGEQPLQQQQPQQEL